MKRDFMCGSVCLSRAKKKRKTSPSTSERAVDADFLVIVRGGTRTKDRRCQERWRGPEEKEAFADAL